METGVATRSITDWAAYEKQLKALVCSLVFLFQSAVKMMIFLTALCVLYLSMKGMHISVL